MLANGSSFRREACGRWFFVGLPGGLGLGLDGRSVVFFFFESEIEGFMRPLDLFPRHSKGLFLPSPIIVLLNGKGSGEQALKGRLVQCRVKAGRTGPGCRHGRNGEKAIQTMTIVVQVGMVWNGRKGAFWERFPFGGAAMERRDENGLRKATKRSKVKR